MTARCFFCRTLADPFMPLGHIALSGGSYGPLHVHCLFVVARFLRRRGTPLPRRFVVILPPASERSAPAVNILRVGI